MSKPATPLPWNTSGGYLYGPDGMAMYVDLDMDLNVADANFIVEACNAYPRLLEERERLVEALEKIACFDDTSAGDHLAKTGSLAGFDEPTSVHIARFALASIKESEE